MILSIPGCVSWVLYCWVAWSLYASVWCDQYWLDKYMGRGESSKFSISVRQIQKPHPRSTQCSSSQSDRSGQNCLLSPAGALTYLVVQCVCTQNKRRLYFVHIIVSVLEQQLIRAQNKSVTNACHCPQPSRQRVDWWDAGDGVIQGKNRTQLSVSLLVSYFPF